MNEGIAFGNQTWPENVQSKELFKETIGANGGDTMVEKKNIGFNK